MMLARSILNIKVTLQSVLLSILLVTFTMGGAQTAHAQGLPVQDILSTIQNTFTAISTASLEQKELIWDGLFFDIAQQALEQMTTDMIAWVNSGFDGEPAFVTDLEKHLLGIQDAVAAEFIYGAGLGAVCTPFKIDLIGAIANQYRAQRNSGNSGGTSQPNDAYSCTADKIPGGNQAAFLSGNFNAGGWAMWFETVLNPEKNTPVGVKASADNDLRNAAAKAIAIEQTELDWAGGIKSQKVCNGPLDCTIVTPGSLIKDQITAHLNIPINRLLQADEMNEVIGALFGNLANEAITGVNGLLGLGGNASFSANVYGTSGNLSYLDAVREERENTNNSAQVGSNQIESALRTEAQVLELQLAIVTALDEVSTYFLDEREPYEDDSCWQLEFPVALTDTLNELLEEVPATINTVVTLEALLETYEKSENTTAQMNALRTLSEMQRNGDIAGRTAQIQYDFYLKSELRTEVRDFVEDIDDEVDSC